MRNFTILHTSDWHLGHQLYRKRRDEEFGRFLDWLAAALAENHVDCALVAGDIFDTGVPGAGAQKMYYDFLLNASAAGVADIVITAGNHDSPAFLAASKRLLGSMRVHVINDISDNPDGEILALRDADGSPRAIICAVPYLSERDAMNSAPGESIGERERKLAEGIRAHYRRVAELAEKKRGGAPIPVIAAGHLFVTGAKTGDGERNLYVGALGNLPHDIFPDAFDYVALGHIHRPQKVAGRENIRYSGSPLPMSFGEAGQEKSAVILRFDGKKAVPELLPIPKFRQFESVCGSRAAILGRLGELAGLYRDTEEGVWLEIGHDGSDPVGNLAAEINDIIRDTPLEVLCVRTTRPRSSDPGRTADGRALEEFSPTEMFAARLDQLGASGEARDEMLGAFSELLALYRENRRQGE